MDKWLLKSTSKTKSDNAGNKDKDDVGLGLSNDLQNTGDNIENHDDTPVSVDVDGDSDIESENDTDSDTDTSRSR